MTAFNPDYVFLLPCAALIVATVVQQIRDTKQHRSRTLPPRWLRKSLAGLLLPPGRGNQQ